MPIGVSSAPYAKFTKAGDKHGGEIVDFRVVQTVDFDSKRPQYLQQDPDDGSWSRVFSAHAPDGKPTRIEVTFDRDITGPHFSFLVQDEGVFRTVALPEQGSSIVLDIHSKGVPF